jgi:hypothetical protein
MFVIKDRPYYNREKEHKHIRKEKDPIFVVVLVESCVLEQPLLVRAKTYPELTDR